MSTKKRGLGRGLDALLGAVAPEPLEAGEELRELSLDSLSAGRHQPRRSFDPEALESLTDSIRAQGVVQPIVAREIGDGRFEIVAGERRWRAARAAGLKSIPAVVRRMDDHAAMAVALVENIQRADLNPLEEAEALRRLIDECGLTHETAAVAVGRSRAAVSNLLRVMELEPDVQALLRENRLSLGHAKVLLGLRGAEQSRLAADIVARGLSVRDTERLLEAAAKPSGAPAKARPLHADLSKKIGLPVELHQNRAGKGRLVIGFSSADELQRLLNRIG